MEHPHVISDPAVMMGKPVIAGTRITVELILEELAAGRTRDEVLESHPQLPEDAVSVALSYAARQLGGGLAGADHVRETAPSYAGGQGRRGRVEVDAEEYEELRYRAELFQGILEGLADADAGRVVPHEEAMAELLARYPG